ncbi:MAG: hypothetical protein ACD_42C00484G0005 [uncultured bacterium]|nr:MAG: hypothetical protein ACD_42C00484G0005 [uncultured bacterium]OGT33178.1 MAG: hypothetical protein A3C44_06295 [Gammaproteobacteria bacterium RIFCSPHIGHO2_02_FULL_39_13]OGT49240.1 MAG: hypothetical protein A3E53_07240 [Gammaproteobacteria bacterium RIFCSPHIGHO2_12_FULL_39_24]
MRSDLTDQLQKKYNPELDSQENTLLRALTGLSKTSTERAKIQEIMTKHADFLPDSDNNKSRLLLIVKKLNGGCNVPILPCDLKTISESVIVVSRPRFSLFQAHFLEQCQLNLMTELQRVVSLQPPTKRV